jgi:hypothetical protein
MSPYLFRVELQKPKDATATPSTWLHFPNAPVDPPSDDCRRDEIQHGIIHCGEKQSYPHSRYYTATSQNLRWAFFRSLVMRKVLILYVVLQATADSFQDSEWKERCWIYVIKDEDGQEYRNEAVELTQLKTIDKYLKGANRNDTKCMNAKSPEWILNASEVLVPAATLNTRVMARFDPDSCEEFSTYTRNWRKQTKDCQLDSFKWRDIKRRMWGEGLRMELNCFTVGDWTFQKCTNTLDMMKFAETIIRESVVGIRGSLDLFDLAAGLCAPWPGAGEWLRIRPFLETWKARQEEVNNDKDLLGSVTEGIKEMTMGDN